MLSSMQAGNYRILPFTSFGTPAMRRGYVLGFLSHAENMTTLPAHPKGEATSGHVVLCVT